MIAGVKRRTRSIGLRIAIAILACLAVVSVGVSARTLLADEAARAAAFVAEGQRALARSDRASAALAFERARWLAPRAELVRSAVAATGVKDVEAPVPRAFRLLTSREWAAIAITFGWLSGLAIAFLVARRQSRIARYVALAGGGAFVIAMAGILESNASAPAIVTGMDARLLVAPYSAAPVLESLPNGTMVIVGSPHEEFVRAEGADGSVGWVRRSTVERIASPEI